MASTAAEEYEYDVALSFAGEQRPYVEQVANACRSLGIRVFYDNDERADLWGRDLYQHLDRVYATAARYCVVFVSADYVRKRWTTHEQRSAQERAFTQRSAYILPVVFDDTRAPGLPVTTGHIDARRTTPAQVAALLAEKLGHPGPAELPPPHTAASTPPDGPAVHNSVSGHVAGNVLQAGNITGSIHLGRSADPDE